MRHEDDLQATRDDPPTELAGTSWSVALLRVVGWLGALPYAGVVVLVMTGSPTWSGMGYLAGMGLLVWGLMTLPGRRGAPAVLGARRPRGLARGAALAIVAVAAVRSFTARRGESLEFLPEPRLVARVVDESDVALSGARLLVATGQLGDDRDEMPSAMRSAYATMRAEEGDAPSPVAATYLGMQTPETFDLVVFEPRPGEHAHDAVVFLHGFAGNFALPCWQMARAVGSLGVMTACPSTTWTGDWWTPDGERIVRRTVDALRARGVSRIVLAGLSNGGVGASLLAPKMRSDFAGLVLISGLSPDAPEPGMPTLLVHGVRDSMMPVGMSRAYAARRSAKLVELDAGHFSMLVRAAQNDEAVRAFVADVLRSPSPS